MAYVDTPERVHKVKRDGRVYSIDNYPSLRYLIADLMQYPDEKRPAVMRKQFEKQGVFRALRQAGMKPGDCARLMGVEFELAELPERPKNWLPESDGIKGYKYIEIPHRALGKMTEDEVRALAADLLPAVVKKLVA